MNTPVGLPRRLIGGKLRGMLFEGSVGQPWRQEVGLGVFLDHSVSRGWWRVRLAESIAKCSDLTVDEAHAELRTNTWAELAEATASKYTVICDPRLRAEAVLACLSNTDRTQRSKQHNIERIARRSLTYCAILEGASPQA